MFFWDSLAFSMIQRMLAIWSLVPLPFLKPAWRSGSSPFTYRYLYSSVFYSFCCNVSFSLSIFSTLVFLPGEFHGQRSLVSYRPWGHKELNMTEWLHSLNGLVVFPTFFNLILNFAIRSSWSDSVSSWSCFYWLYRASPCSAAENIISLISVLTIW